MTESRVARPRINPASWRIFFLIPAGVALLTALNAGLLLLGVSTPVANWADLHGVLMVVAFLGTLIAMERAVALRSPLGYLAPGLLGIGGLSLLTPLPLVLGQLLLVEGAVAFVFVYVALWQRSRDDVVMVQLLGAIHLLLATVTWMFAPIPMLLPWFVGFLVLTITAERVELARLTMPRSGENILVAAGAGMTLTIAATTFWPDLAVRATAIIILTFTAWLVHHDVARKLIRAAGLPRFSAAALLGGYVWLAVAAIVWLVFGFHSEGFLYDAAVHGVMLGFAMSMIMAHAPIILPAVLRRPLPYKSAMWVPLGLLHLGLLVRIVLGDFAENTLAWQVGGTLNVIAVLAFVVTAIVSSVLGSRAQAQRNKRSAGQLTPQHDSSLTADAAPSSSTESSS